MTDPFGIPAFTLTRDGDSLHTTVAKALDDLAEHEAKKRPARRCSECGQYRTHDDSKIIATDDGDSRRICRDCLDDASAAKAQYRQQWAEAVEAMDEAIAKSRRVFPFPQGGRAGQGTSVRAAGKGI